MAIDIEKNKNKLTKWIRNYIVSEENAPKIDNFLAFLENSDFYTAPASTNHHLNCEGGLCQHTLNVIYRMFKICNNDYSEEEIKKTDYKEKVFLVALLHDICKVNLYKKTVKTENNKKIPVWKEEIEFPMGTCERSLYISQKYFTLTDEEAAAIRYYRGFNDPTVKCDYSVMNNIYSKFPLTAYLSFANKQAKFFDEEVISY